MYSKALYNTIFLLQLRIFKLFKGEKFDDIKFGKVLTKLYARLFSCEEHKYMPPKYSFALKDLAVFLGIFEVKISEKLRFLKWVKMISNNNVRTYLRQARTFPIWLKVHSTLTNTALISSKKIKSRRTMRMKKVDMMIKLVRKSKEVKLKTKESKLAKRLKAESKIM